MNSWEVLPAIPAAKMPCLGKKRALTACFYMPTHNMLFFFSSYLSKYVAVTGGQQARGCVFLKTRIYLELKNLVLKRKSGPWNSLKFANSKTHYCIVLLLSSYSAVFTTSIVSRLGINGPIQFVWKDNIALKKILWWMEKSAAESS